MKNEVSNIENAIIKLLEQLSTVATGTIKQVPTIVEQFAMFSYYENIVMAIFSILAILLCLIIAYFSFKFIQNLSSDEEFEPNITNIAAIVGLALPSFISIGLFIAIPRNISNALHAKYSPVTYTIKELRKKPTCRD